MDGRRNNKGTKGNAGGRKPKSDELELLDTISKAGMAVYGTEPYKQLWSQIWEQAQTGSKDHQQMILQYTYGKPKQIVAIENAELEFKITKAVD